MSASSHDRSQMQDRFAEIFAHLPEQDIEQFYAHYQLWILRHRAALLEKQIQSLREHIAENNTLIQASQPSPIALAVLARLQSNGVSDTGLLDQMLERGEDWLDQMMQRLDYCEQVEDFILGDYTQWCMNSLEGAYDWIDTVRGNREETGKYTTVISPDTQLTEELLLQKLKVDDEESGPGNLPQETISPALAEHFDTPVIPDALSLSNSEENELSTLFQPVAGSSEPSLPLDEREERTEHTDEASVNPAGEVPSWETMESVEARNAPWYSVPLDENAPFDLEHPGSMHDWIQIFQADSYSREASSDADLSAHAEKPLEAANVADTIDASEVTQNFTQTPSEDQTPSEHTGASVEAQASINEPELTPADSPVTEDVPVGEFTSHHPSDDDEASLVLPESMSDDTLSNQAASIPDEELSLVDEPLEIDELNRLVESAGSELDLKKEEQSETLSAVPWNKETTGDAKLSSVDAVEDLRVSQTSSNDSILPLSAEVSAATSASTTREPQPSEEVPESSGPASVDETFSSTEVVNNDNLFSPAALVAPASSAPQETVETHEQPDNEEDLSSPAALTSVASSSVQEPDNVDVISPLEALVVEAEPDNAMRQETPMPGEAEPDEEPIEGSSVEPTASAETQPDSDEFPELNEENSSQEPPTTGPDTVEMVELVGQDDNASLQQPVESADHPATEQEPSALQGAFISEASADTAEDSVFHTESAPEIAQTVQSNEASDRQEDRASNEDASTQNEALYDPEGDQYIEASASSTDVQPLNETNIDQESTEERVDISDISAGQALNEVAEGETAPHLSADLPVAEESERADTPILSEEKPVFIPTKESKEAEPQTPEHEIKQEASSQQSHEAIEQQEVQALSQGQAENSEEFIFLGNEEATPEELMLYQPDQDINALDEGDSSSSLEETARSKASETKDEVDQPNLAARAEIDEHSLNEQVVDVQPSPLSLEETSSDADDDTKKEEPALPWYDYLEVDPANMPTPAIWENQQPDLAKEQTQPIDLQSILQPTVQNESGARIAQPPSSTHQAAKSAANATQTSAIEPNWDMADSETIPRIAAFPQTDQKEMLPSSVAQTPLSASPGPTPAPTATGVASGSSGENSPDRTAAQVAPTTREPDLSNQAEQRQTPLTERASNELANKKPGFWKRLLGQKP